MATVPPEAGEAADQGPPPPPHGLDPDAHDAVVAELDRIDSGENWTPPDPVTGGEPAQIAPTLYQEGTPQRGYRPPDPPTPHSEGPHVRSVIVSPEARVTRGPRDPRTLEDLYAIFPHIGNGIYFMRVTRKEPKLYRGQKVNGWIADVHEQITLSQFRDNFGGERFTVAVLGPRAPKDAAERPTVQQLAEMDIQIPGPPAWGSLPQADEDDIMTQRQPMAMGRPMALGPAYDPTVAAKELDIQADRERRAEDERRGLQSKLIEQAGTTPREIAAATAEATTRAVESVRETSKEVVDMLRENLGDQQRRIIELTGELKSTQAKLVEAESKAAQALYHGETKAVIELRERHGKELSDFKERTAKELKDATERLQNEMSSLKDRHADELRRVREELTSKVESATKETTSKLEGAQHDYRDRVRELEASFERERQRIREEAERREKAIKDDYERTERNFKEQYDARIKDLERQTSREIVQTNTDRDTRLRAIEEQYKGQVNFTEKTTQMQLDSANRETARLEGKLKTAEEELARLREKTTEDVPTAIAKAHTLAEMTGWGPRDEKAGGGEEEGEFDWKKALAKAGMALVEKSPELMQKLGEVRQQNAATTAATRAPVPQQGPPGVGPGPRGPQPQQQRRLAPPPGMGMRPAPPIAQRPFVVAAPQTATQPMPGYDGRGSVVFGQPPTGLGYDPPAVGSRPMPPPTPAPQPAAQPQAEPTPQWMPAPNAPIPGVTGPAAAAAPADPSQPPPAGPQAEGAPIPGLTEAHIHEFVDELEKAIRGKVVGAPGFANLFIGRIGPQIAAQVAIGVHPDQLIQLLQTTPGAAEQSQIVTREGQKYVRAVWDELRKQLGLAAA